MHKVYYTVYSSFYSPVGRRSGRFLLAAGIEHNVSRLSEASQIMICLFYKFLDSYTFILNCDVWRTGCSTARSPSELLRAKRFNRCSRKYRPFSQAARHRQGLGLSYFHLFICRLYFIYTIFKPFSLYSFTFSSAVNKI